MKNFTSQRTWVKSLFPVPLLAGTFLALYPPEGSFFWWWEYHIVHFMLALLGVGLLAFVFNHKQLMFTSFAACAILCLHLENQSGSNDFVQETEGFPALKVAYFKLIGAKDSPDTVLQVMLHSGADLISIQHDGPGMPSRMASLLTQNGYQYQEHLQASPLVRLNIFSRIPFDHVRQTAEHYSHSVSGKLLLKVDGEEYPVHFFNTFLDAEETNSRSSLFREELGQLALDSRFTDAPLLAFGQFNMVEWSKELRQFKAESGLLDSRHGSAPTNSHGFFSLRNYPLDHMFYNDYFKCTSFETISSAGREQLGIMGTFELIKQPESDAKSSSQKLSIRLQRYF